MSNGALAARFFEKTIPEPNSGCLLWTGGSRSGDGYGMIDVAGKTYQAHRVAWQMEHGPIPSGAYVCHRCDTPACVNVAHLFLGTQRDNVRDAWRKGRARNLVADAERALTHCARGHPFDGVNSYVHARRDGTTRRICRACRRQRKHRRYHAQRAPERND